jgi:hypothetical protein
MNAKHITVPVSRRAVIARVGRALKSKGQRLVVDRHGGEPAHVLVDDTKNTIIKTGVDVVRLAQELDLFAPWEKLECGRTAK